MTRGRRTADAAPSPDLELRSRIPAAAHGATLLDYLLLRFRYHDRAAWLAEFAAGRLWLDGTPARPEQPLRTGAELLYRKHHEEPRVAKDLQVLHATPDFAVVEKPAHLPMHADGPFVRHTLIHLLRSGPLPDAALVHRLDRETSGLCVVARNKAARQLLERQFADGLVGKAYLAVVRGHVAADFSTAAPIGLASRSTIALRRSAAADAIDPKPARTDFLVVAAGAGASLLRCVPHTGRTHQIRVHLEHCGHPLLGDKLYGRPDADYLAFVHRVKAGGDARDVDDGGPDRQLLHAAELTFLAPPDGRSVAFTSPAPPEFQVWLDRLG